MHQDDRRGAISPTQRSRVLLPGPLAGWPASLLSFFRAPTARRRRESHLVALDVPDVTCEGSVSPDLRGQVLQRQCEGGRRAAPAVADDHARRRHCNGGRVMTHDCE